MIVNPIKTPRIIVNQTSLTGLLDENLKEMPDSSILVITSKVVSLCENRVLAINKVNKEELIKQEADHYAVNTNKFGFRYTITKNTLIPSAGIDESNGNNNYILWPLNSQETANTIREYLVSRFGHKNIGVVITDSTTMPLRRGTTGIYLAHSGFKALNNYVGKADLFGRIYKVSKASVASGLAASAVVTMGEGSEQTPLCLITDIPFVEFQDRNPDQDELSELNISVDDDVFGQFLTAIEWQSDKSETLTK